MDAALLVQYKALSAPTLTLPDTLFSTFWLFPSFLLKINAFTMRYEIWKGREKKKFGQSAKGGIEPLVDRVKKILLVIYHLRHRSWCFSWLCCASSGSSFTLIDRCLVQSAIYSQTNGAVSNYTYLFRFVWFVVVFSDLLFCFRICRCVFWLVIMFSGLLLCFLNCYFVFYICICYFVFRIVICFALIGHRRECLIMACKMMICCSGNISYQCLLSHLINLKHPCWIKIFFKILLTFEW